MARGLNASELYWNLPFFWNCFGRLLRLINAKCFNDRQKRRWLPVVKGQIIYGTNSVREALNADRRQVYKLYFKRNFLLGRREDVRKKLLEEILSVAESKDIRIKELSTDQLDALCGYQLHNVCLISLLKQIGGAET